MQISVSGHHVEVTEALKNYVNEKIKRVERHFNNITHVNVILSVENKIHQKAEATVNSSGKQIYADSSSKDMYKSIDKMVDRLVTQVQKHKEHMKDHDDED